MKRKLIAFDPGPELLEAVEKKAEDEGLSVSEVIREALRINLGKKGHVRIMLLDGKKRVEFGPITSRRVGKG